MSEHILRDAPEIARLRGACDLPPYLPLALAIVQASDLRYALARLDHVCRGCFVVETVARQAETIRQAHLQIDDLLARASLPPTGDADPSLNLRGGAPDVPARPSAVIVHARICRVEGCPRAHDDWADRGIGV